MSKQQPNIERWVTDLLQNNAKNHPNLPAMQNERMAVTYHDLKLWVEKWTRAFEAAGLPEGVCVGLLFEHQIECMV
ncbi:MAG: hypothetical protein RI556_12275, partial [Hydrogenovibrio sp.]|uniref:hypothetical protein n=1 Tax=Hydrogenovibrio sp. TaxID=2065821 RepID=UPI00286FE8F1